MSYLLELQDATELTKKEIVDFEAKKQHLKNRILQKDKQIDKNEKSNYSSEEVKKI